MALSPEQIGEIKTDGLSDYDLAHFGEIVAGQGDWFHAKLVRMCAKADENNLSRLEESFPGTVLAFRIWMQYGTGAWEYESDTPTD